MAMKYISVPQRGMTIAILDGTSLDALNKIDKIVNRSKNHDKQNCYDVFFSSTRYLMADQYRGTVICRDPDKFDVEEGKRLAKEKAIRNYHRAMDKRLARFENDFRNMTEIVLGKA